MSEERIIRVLQDIVELLWTRGTIDIPERDRLQEWLHDAHLTPGYTEEEK